ncbi:unnamed protein product [Nezara viridula]|uniref:C2H2-type domain-containing protein n=1 Tax=Nezara viridula TaxID=85310 RepID=A0A9P0HCL8_NEZVI|nr:unnamed protein product [Nezara viridula]
MTFHVYNKHGVIKRRRYTCSTCQRTYSNRQNLNRHVKYECGKPPSFKCQFCHKGFTQNHALKVHVFKSTEEGHYCYSCGRKYKYKKHLNRHVRYECGKAPSFLCPHCPKGFSRKQSLTFHVFSKHKDFKML